ncbi:MAG TPA: hypothetical protein VIM31_03350 [Candidatus Microsaccharimonas sp.]
MKGRVHRMLTKNKSKIGRRPLMMAAAGLLLVAGAVAGGAGAANATTVYNRLYCDQQRNACYQVNGAHNSSIKNQCFWQYGGTVGYNNQYHVADCTAGWGTPIWQYAP